ncbi:hypothetical protein DMN91_004860 [Ooceraea biroi]|uniref:Uncharacterized protein n=1 Tax=Ooceraea biroi TaxID=2015173 RepID=A0A3L8DQP2_OOCBI|nr:hypothetical protein DMN91_004860 [Ooceraea biroi]
MNGFRIWTLQDLSHVLLARSLQKEKVCETKITNLSAVFNNLGSIFTAPIPLPEIASISFSCRLLAYLLHSETNTKKCLEVLKPNIASEWSSMPYPGRKYHTWKVSRAEVNIIKEVQQRGTCLGSSRFNRLKSQKFYASCSKDKDSKSIPSCETPKKEHETKKECETKKKCIKGPANCLTRKSVTDELQTCQKDQKLSKPAEKSGIEEYCTSKKEPVKDKKSEQELMKEQIDREFKEIEECKRGKDKEKKDDKCKKATLDYKPTGLDRVISPCKENQKKDQFTSTPSEQISSNFANVTHRPLSIQLGVINSVVAMCTKNVTLFNAMFDRSFSTMKVNYQDDVAINRITDNDKIVDNYYANNNDFLHGDELPLYVEVENEEENEVDDHDWVTEQSTVKTV